MTGWLHVKLSYVPATLAWMFELYGHPAHCPSTAIEPKADGCS